MAEVYVGFFNSSFYCGKVLIYNKMFQYTFFLKGFNNIYNNDISRFDLQ